MKKPIALAVVLCTTLLASCGDAIVQNINGPVATSRVKFFNFGVNSPGVNFYANTQKMTAISSTTGAESVIGVVQGGAASGGFYSAIAPGSYDLTGKIAAATDKDATAAWVVAKQFVIRQLKSPASADFGSPFSGEFQQPNDRCKVIDGGAWKCAGWVDAQNEFAAKLRSDFTVTVRPDPDGAAWSMIDGPTLVPR